MLSQEETTAILLEERLSLTAFLVTITRSYHLAEDVFQDLCVKCIVREEPFETREHLLNWARLVGKNRSIDLLRSRDGKYLGLQPEVLEALAAAWPDQQHGSGKPRVQALQECLERLTSNNRQILRLRYFEGRSGADVAACLGRKVESVYQALARIHKTLGECIQSKIAASEGRS
jgi:RNA polymerase sigma-70 factor (ECF subfamily)